MNITTRGVPPRRKGKGDVTISTRQTSYGQKMAA